MEQKELAVPSAAIKMMIMLGGTASLILHVTPSAVIKFSVLLSEIRFAFGTLSNTSASHQEYLKFNVRKGTV